MTCKDCYHYEMCLPRVAVGGNKICQYFKDKLLIVELPCKVWDEVYYITIKRYAPLTHKIVEAEVLDYNIDGYGICDVKIRPLNSEYAFTTSVDKVFFTKSEAEAKLKELNRSDLD